MSDYMIADLYIIYMKAGVHMKTYRDFLDYLIKCLQGETELAYGVRYQIDYALSHKSITQEEYDNLIAMLNDVENDEEGEFF
jgi:hypothetical protein